MWKRLDKKSRIDFKNLRHQTGQQIITIYILPNILMSKGNEVRKFGQLIEQNMKKFS